MSDVMDYEDRPDLGKVINEARARFRACESWESQFRNFFRNDIKFANADADNGYQWPNDIRRNRDVDERPCLTVNMTAQHNGLIVNEMLQNLPSIKYSATGGGATFEAAQIWTGIAKQIEYRSNASAIYGHAIRSQVEGGVGYWRVVTEYSDDESFDQDIRIQQIYDPMTVYIDPDAREPDKSDMRFAFIWEDVPRDKFDKEHPGMKEISYRNAIGTATDWTQKDHVRVAEYYRVKEKKDTLLLLTLSDGSTRKLFASDIQDAEVRKEFSSRPDTVKRKIVRKIVEWYEIVGDKIVDQKVWVGQTIPIVQIVGKETIIEGILDRKGHTRAMKDPQRIYNYWTSSAVEFGALQAKTPWIAPAEAIEGYESYWNTANRVNHSVLAYRALDDAGNKIEAPQRTQPPVASPVALQGMQIASQELEAVSGQYAAQKGQMGNERSASTLEERQKQSDKATYHFAYQLAIGIRYTGKILLDIIPKIYDTERVVMMQGEDGQSLEIKIDPAMQKAHQMEMQQQVDVTSTRVLNPKVGKYDVMATVGPNYATKREQAFEAFKLILTQNPQMTAIIGDILFRAGDFPLAEEAAARLRRMIPAQALGTGPTQNEQALMAQLEQANGLLKNVMEVLAEERLKARSKTVQRDIDLYKAVTERVKSLNSIKPEEATMTYKELEALAMQAFRESLEVDLDGSQKVINDTLDLQGELPL